MLSKFYCFSVSLYDTYIVLILLMGVAIVMKRVAKEDKVTHFIVICCALLIRQSTQV